MSTMSPEKISMADMIIPTGFIKSHMKYIRLSQPAVDVDQPKIISAIFLWDMVMVRASSTGAQKRAKIDKTIPAPLYSTHRKYEMATQPALVRPRDTAPRTIFLSLCWGCLVLCGSGLDWLIYRSSFFGFSILASPRSLEAGVDLLQGRLGLRLDLPLSPGLVDQTFSSAESRRVR